MKTMTSSEFEANYLEGLGSVVDDQEELVVTRPGRDSVVVVPLDYYRSLKETLYLLGNRANARQLLDSIDELEGGDGEVRDPSSDLREFRHDVTQRLERLENKMDRVLDLLEGKAKK